MSLKEAYKVIQDIKHTTGSGHKQAKLQIALFENTPYLKAVCLYAYDFNKRFNVKKIKEQFNSSYELVSGNKILAWLDHLASQKGTTNKDKQYLSSLASTDEETFKCVQLILKKDLDCGLALKSIKKEIPELPEHGTMLCGLRMTNHLLEDVDKFVEANKGWDSICWSIKKNGVRVNIYVTDDKVIWLSRSGKEYHNFHKFDPALIIMANTYKTSNNKKTIEFDGEMTPKDKSFNNLMGQTRRVEDADDSIFQLELFDLPTEPSILFKRLSILKVCIDIVKSSSLFEIFTLARDIHYVEHPEKINSLQDVLALLDKVDAEGEEGLVLKGMDSPYVHGNYVHGKNHKYWMKVKKFNEADCRVLEVVEGEDKYSAKGQCKTISDKLMKVRSTKDLDKVNEFKEYLTAKAFNEDPELHTWVETLEFYDILHWNQRITSSMGALVVDFNGKKVKVGGGYSDTERAVFMHHPPTLIEVHYKEITEDGSMLFPTFARVREDK